MREAVNQLEEALQGEDDNIESPCCIVSCWQPRGRNQQQTLLQHCTVLHINGVYKCVCVLLWCVCVRVFASTHSVFAVGDNDKSRQGQITEIEWITDDYTAVCIFHTM